MNPLLIITVSKKHPVHIFGSLFLVYKTHSSLVSVSRRLLRFTAQSSCYEQTDWSRVSKHYNQIQRRLRIM